MTGPPRSLGTVQLSGGATDDARKSFLAAIKVKPQELLSGIVLMTATLYINQKDYDEAIKVVRSGIEQRPDATSLQMILANVFEQKADFESAIAQYQSVLDKEPGNLIATNNLAGLLLDHRSDSSSLEKAQLLASFLRKSEIPQFKDTPGWANYHRGDYRAAVLLSEEASAALLRSSRGPIPILGWPIWPAAGSAGPPNSSRRRLSLRRALCWRSKYVLRSKRRDLEIRYSIERDSCLVQGADPRDRPSSGLGRHVRWDQPCNAALFNRGGAEKLKHVA